MISPNTLSAFINIVGPEQIVSEPDALLKLSRDYYWYSPILKQQLADKCADVVVKVSTLAQLTETIKLCFREGLPVVLRGAATGNYGQIIPIHGGVMIDINGMDEIFELGPILRCQPGVKLRTIEEEGVKVGWENRCLPSTWVSCTVGGFICGGSGGIGSISYGGLATPGNIKSVTLLTVEAEPQLIKLEEPDCLTAIHTYGTNGIVVELEMRLAPAKTWTQVVATHPSWDLMLDWCYRLSGHRGIFKRLVTLCEWPIPASFKAIKKYLPDGDQAALLMIEEKDMGTFRDFAAADGIKITHESPFTFPQTATYLTNFTWNHTTLWVLKSDPTATYLQCGFEDNFAEQFNLLRQRFPGQVEQHLEFVMSNPKMGDDTGQVRVGGIPIVRYQSDEQLLSIIAYCAEIGVSVANPHTYVLEEGGRHADIAAKYALKDRVDPKGLLNPGKMKGYAKNPFLAHPVSA